eukprot:gene6694-4792_t
MEPNGFEAVKGRLSAAALRDIEGIDPNEFGFGRKECCGPVPGKLHGSMKLKNHVFMGTTMPATEWAPKTENVPGFGALAALVKQEDQTAAFNVCHTTGADPIVLYVEDGATPAGVRITQYGVPDPLDAVPWKAKGTVAVDRSAEYFVFVCAHLTRDKRCGFCGVVLVDLLRSCIAQRTAATPGRAPAITVLPCSHVGGHIYAGNVLVYSRFGGVAFGLFRPQDVEALVDSMLADQGAVPAELVDRVRGHMGTSYQALD